MNYLDELNSRQKEAVLHKNGPLLVIAGAGAGKTKVITNRIFHLIRNGVAPESILAVTFTNKAAKEMKERVEQLLSEDSTLNFPIKSCDRPFISTFHSLGVHILREHHKVVGISKRFSIFDKSDSSRAVKSAVVAAGLDPKEFESKVLLSAISKQKGKGVSAMVFRQTVGNEFFPRVVSAVWDKYEDQLKRESALDFDDLLLRTVALLRSNPNIKHMYQNKWHYVHIDEYQDTNKVQNEMSLLLAGSRQNICVVGDVDQTIYSWRGADTQNIMGFEQQYRDVTTVLLEENYRSTKNILEASNSIIRKNKNRREKNLFTKKRGGDKITLLSSYDEAGEALSIVEKVKELLKNDVQPRDIAVLYRANFQSRALEEAFLGEKLPYQVLGVRFFERKEIKDVLSFIRASLNPESISDIKRIISVPPRGIGKIALLKIASKKENELKGKAKENVENFKIMLRDIESCALSKKPSETIRYVLKRTGLEESLKGKGEEELERLENIKELATFALRYDILPKDEGIEKLLEDAALVADQDELKEESNATRLMTVHASKGLEFEYVFVAGLEDGLFPHKALSDSNADNEEERRLFYVALTRARKKVFLSYASVRTIFGSREVSVPSEFITDIDENLIEEDVSIFKKEKIIYID
ncbi:UvrD-helicase domain-containing protein [Patescibacteria group bacterium]|nr:UvrD-helicase domain-containing protein [Patescibacteria group bacterium]